MQTFLRAGLLVAPLLLSSACGLFTEPVDRAITLSIDQTRYAPELLGGTGNDRRFAFSVVARFANGSRDTVYLARCFPSSPGPIFGVAMERTTRASAFDGAWACVGHDQQHAIAPNTVRTDTLRLFGPGARSGVSGEILGELSGRMFLSYEVQRCRGDGACRLPKAAQSSVFVVESMP